MVKAATNTSVNPKFAFSVSEGNAEIACSGDISAVIFGTTGKNFEPHVMALSHESVLKLASKFLAHPVIRQVYPHAALPEELHNFDGTQDERKNIIAGYRSKYKADFGECDQFGSSNVVGNLKRDEIAINWGDVSVQYSSGKSEFGALSFIFRAPGPVSLALMTDIFVSFISDSQSKRYYPNLAAGYLRRWGEELFEGVCLKANCAQILTKDIKLKPQDDEDESSLFNSVAAEASRVAAAGVASSQEQDSLSQESSPKDPVMPPAQLAAELASIEKLKAELTEKQRLLTNAFSELAFERKNLEKERASLAQDANSKAMSDLAKERAALEEDKRAFEKVKLRQQQEIEDLKKELKAGSDEEKKKLAAIRQKLSDEIEALNDKGDQLNKSYEELKVRENELEENHADLASQAELLTKAQLQIDEEKRSIEEKLKELNSEKENLAKKFAELEAGNERLSREEEEIERLTVQQLKEFEEREKEISARERELIEIEKRISAMIASSLINSKNGNGSYAKRDVDV